MTLPYNVKLNACHFEPCGCRKERNLFLIQADSSAEGRSVGMTNPGEDAGVST